MGDYDIEMDAAARWDAIEKDYYAIDERERLWLEGFINGLLFVQASYDVKDGMQTIKTHLPDEWFDPDSKEWKKLENLEDKLKTIVNYTDDGGIVAMRFVSEHTDYDGTLSEPVEVRKLEIGGSEGYHGTPDWA